MNSWKIILATVVIFGAGVVTGGLLVNHVERTRPVIHRPPRQPQAFTPRPEILKTNFVRRLDRAVHLTPVQRGRIEKIIAEGQKRNRELWKKVAPEFRPVILEVRRRIHQVLTPEQQKRFEQLLRHVPRRSLNTTNAPSSSARAPRQ